MAKMWISKVPRSDAANLYGYAVVGTDESKNPLFSAPWLMVCRLWGVLHGHPFLRLRD